ncbi:alkaline phosphatase [Candidatus Magnetomorum sp. HK-1]|nr:alkaline phosphatase [Candidatus Magnetomorum sp. HK-1]
MNKKSKSYVSGFVAIIIFSIIFAGCILSDYNNDGKIGLSDTLGLFKRTPLVEKPIKNVIILIGDGMGPQAVGLLIQYAKHAKESKFKEGITTIERAINSGTLGMAYHNAYNTLVTDSAASATQISTGKDALSETIGVDKDGHSAKTILEIAEEMGKSTGLISDTRLTHATPAAFASHQYHRSKENEIAVQMLNSGAEVLLSGGLRHFIPQKTSDKWAEIHAELSERTNGKIKIKSKRKDNRNLLAEAIQKGYAVALTKDEMTKADNDKLLGLFNYSDLGYTIDCDTDDPERTIPTLKEMAAKALDILSKNENGFFLMVESGLIDWAEHDNDAGTLLHEMIKFDKTLNYIYEWAKDRDDTLLLVSADHETGGFSFSYSRKDVPFASPVDFPGDEFKGAKFGSSYNFGSFDVLTKIYNQKTSYSHMLAEFEKKAPYDFKSSYKPSSKTIKQLQKIINSNTEFPITYKDAKAILATEKNEYYVKKHGYLKSPFFPKVHDFKEFYISASKIRRPLIARVVAKQQYAVWSTGGHTNTPVPLIACGPKKVTEKFGKLLHTTEWGQMAISVIKNGQ